MIKIAEEKEAKKQKERYVLAEIATQTEPIIVDSETKEQHNVLTFLAKIGNDLEQIKKAL